MPKVDIVDPKVERKARKIQIPDISLNRYRTKLERETERYGKKPCSRFSTTCC